MAPKTLPKSPQNRPKINQKSMKNRYGKVIEFLIEKWRGRCSRASAVSLGWGPLKSINPGVQGDIQGPCTLHFVPQGHGGGYIYIYIYIFIYIYIHIYLYMQNISATVPLRHEVECTMPLWMSWVAAGVSECPIGIMD